MVYVLFLFAVFYACGVCCDGLHFDCMFRLDVVCFVRCFVGCLLVCGLLVLLDLCLGFIAFCGYCIV